MTNALNKKTGFINPTFLKELFLSIDLYGIKKNSTKKNVINVYLGSAVNTLKTKSLSLALELFYLLNSSKQLISSLIVKQPFLSFTISSRKSTKNKSKFSPNYQILNASCVIPC